MTLAELRTWIARRVVRGAGAPTLQDLVREVPLSVGRAREMLAEGIEKRLFAAEHPEKHSHALGPPRYGVRNPVRRVVNVSMVTQGPNRVELAPAFAKHGSSVIRLTLACGHTRPCPENMHPKDGGRPIQPRVGGYADCHFCLLEEGGYEDQPDERRNLRSTILDQTTAEVERTSFSFEDGDRADAEQG